MRGKKIVFYHPQGLCWIKVFALLVLFFVYLGEGGGVGVLDEERIEGGEEEGQGEDAQVEDQPDHRRPGGGGGGHGGEDEELDGDDDDDDDGPPLHVVDPLLGEPVEGLQEEQQREQRHELRREIVPEVGFVLIC